MSKQRVPYLEVHVKGPVQFFLYNNQGVRNYFSKNKLKSEKKFLHIARKKASRPYFNVTLLPRNVVARLIKLQPATECIINVSPGIPKTIFINFPNRRNIIQTYPSQLVVKKSQNIIEN